MGGGGGGGGGDLSLEKGFRFTLHKGLEEGGSES